VVETFPQRGIDFSFCFREATELLEFWKKSALRIRVLERDAAKEVDSLKEDSSKASFEGSTCHPESLKREMIEKLSTRNSLRRSLKEAISTMQLTRELVEKGLLLRSSMKLDLNLKGESSEILLNESSNSDSVVEYNRCFEKFQISTAPIASKITSILDKAHDESKGDNNHASITTSEIESEMEV
jgi:hypothetical protein